MLYKYSPKTTSFLAVAIALVLYFFVCTGHANLDFN